LIDPKMAEDSGLAIKAARAVADDGNAGAGPGLSLEKRHGAIADLCDGFPREQSERVRLPKFPYLIGDVRSCVSHFDPFPIGTAEIRQQRDYSGSAADQLGT